MNTLIGTAVLLGLGMVLFFVLRGNKLEKGNKLMLAGRYDLALECYQKVLAGNPKSLVALWKAAQAAQGLKESAVALGYLQTIKQTPSWKEKISPIDLLTICGKLSFERNDSLNAYINYKELEQLQPACPELLFILGTINMVHQKSLVAIDYFRKLVKQKPNHAQGAFNLSISLVANNDYGEAMVEVEKSLKMLPNNYSVSMVYALTKLMHQDVDLAVENLFKSLGLTTDVQQKLKIGELLALIEFNRKNYTAAYQIIQDIISDTEVKLNDPRLSRLMEVMTIVSSYLVDNDTDVVEFVCDYLQEHGGGASPPVFAATDGAEAAVSEAEMSYYMAEMATIQERAAIQFDRWYNYYLDPESLVSYTDHSQLRLFDIEEVNKKLATLAGSLVEPSGKASTSSGASGVDLNGMSQDSIKKHLQTFIDQQLNYEVLEEKVQRNVIDFVCQPRGERYSHYVTYQQSSSKAISNMPILDLATKMEAEKIMDATMITNTSFSNEATEAAHKHNIRLIDGKSLSNSLAKLGV